MEEESRAASTISPKTLRAGMIIAAIALAVLGAIKLPHLLQRRKHAALQRRVNEVLKDYHPQPDRFPPTLAAYLPEQTPGNACDDYAIAFQLNSPRPGEDLGPLQPAQVASVERGIRKQDCAIFGVSYLPKSGDMDLLYHTTRLSRMILTVSRHFQTRIAAFEQAGDPAAAEAEYAKAVAFGEQMMQDWDMVSQGLGLNLVLSSTLRLEISRVKRGADPFEERLRATKIALELKAFFTKKEEINRIESAVRNRENLPLLHRYCEEPALRRSYCMWTLFTASGGWTDEEIHSAAPWPGRVDLLKRAAASDDQRVSAIGNAYLAILTAEQDRYMRLPVPERLTRPR